MASLDFDGDYGRHYDQRIRRIIPAYDAHLELAAAALGALVPTCLLYTSPSPRDATLSRMPSSA